MRVMNLEQTTDFMRSDLQMDVSPDWVRKQAEPDVNGKRRLPVFRLTGGERAPLYTTDVALKAHFLELSKMALSELHGKQGIAANLLQAQIRSLSDSEELQEVPDRTPAAKSPRWRR
ncbi:MAG TPA: hypothetical protein VN809_07585 [Telmatospirillum sp.]|nr:hypothetical protein [Telmatospirillum sp.]